MKLQTFVQTVPGRERALEHTLRGLRNSDLRSEPIVRAHPPGLSVRGFLLQLLREMADSDADLVLRCEDDITPSSHLERNIQSWPELHDRRFGAGWLFAAAGSRSIIDHIYQRPGSSRWHRNWVHVSCAVLFWRQSLPELIQGIEDAIKQDPPTRDGGQDKLIGQAVAARGKQICVHVPSLVEHDLTLGSSMGHVHVALYDAAREGFQRDWQRGQRFSVR